MGSAKENILNKIKQALEIPVPVPFPELSDAPVFKQSLQDNLLDVFRETFIGIQGNYVRCENEAHLINVINALLVEKKWRKIYCKSAPLIPFLQDAGAHFTEDLAGCDVSFTICESLVARTGTMVLSAAQEEGRTASVYAPVHVCIAYANQLVYDTEDALKKLQNDYGETLPSFISFATGPSRTADIEKTLVTGVHGPKEVFCIVVEG